MRCVRFLPLFHWQDSHSQCTVPICHMSAFSPTGSSASGILPVYCIRAPEYWSTVRIQILYHAASAILPLSVCGSYTILHNPHRPPGNALSSESRTLSVQNASYKADLFLCYMVIIFLQFSTSLSYTYPYYSPAASFLNTKSLCPR